MGLRRIGDAPIIIKKIIEGTPGPRGLPGENGITTVVTETITKDGIPGKDGMPGEGPVHQTRNGEVRFMSPDGTWGEWITVSTGAGGGGPDSYNKYTSIQQANFRIQRQSLTLGTNIFGVDFNGDVEIILPNGIDKRILIVIKDESNNAGTNNITVTTES